MHGDGLTVIVFLGALVGAALSLYVNVSLAKEEASTITDYQLFSLMEMPLGFVASVILVVVMSV